ncbi:hypothetical protein IQ268_08685 [Oculatella sp. LEGE 06141]|uniref:hypothetical protein n=1 Tax=Oculatella sp. LEGE 06141 TaxID=1828648 RepID=UPI00188207F5|nr:hypothetical protein [Oculatella sp. LEGE 06141]MBE9178634.1 hypothetical protein [Oculatella sp. LEGE 06141]
MAYQSRTRRHEEDYQAPQSNWQEPADSSSGKWQGRRWLSALKDTWIFSLLYWTAALIALFFCWLNIFPYSRAVEYLVGLTGVVPTSGVVAWLAGIPLSIIFWLLGAILWLFIQICETAPVFVERNRILMQGIINDAESGRKYSVRPWEDPLLQSLKKVYNRLPLQTVATARNAACFAYILDFCVVSTIYPPIEGGFDRAWLVLMTGQWNQINWGNVAAIGFCLYCVEFLVKVMFGLSNLITHLKAHR